MVDSAHGLMQHDLGRSQLLFAATRALVRPNVRDWLLLYKPMMLCMIAGHGRTISAPRKLLQSSGVTFEFAESVFKLSLLLPLTALYRLLTW